MNLGIPQGGPGLFVRIRLYVHNLLQTHVHNLIGAHSAWIGRRVQDTFFQWHGASISRQIDDCIFLGVKSPAIVKILKLLAEKPFHLSGLPLDFADRRLQCLHKVVNQPLPVAGRVRLCARALICRDLVVARADDVTLGIRYHSPYLPLSATRSLTEGIGYSHQRLIFVTYRLLLGERLLHELYILADLPCQILEILVPKSLKLTLIAQDDVRLIEAVTHTLSEIFIAPAGVVLVVLIKIALVVFVLGFHSTPSNLLVGKDPEEKEAPREISKSTDFSRVSYAVNHPSWAICFLPHIGPNLLNHLLGQIRRSVCRSDLITELL